MRECASVRQIWHRELGILPTFSSMCEVVLNLMSSRNPPTGAMGDLSLGGMNEPHDKREIGIVTDVHTCDGERYSACDACETDPPPPSQACPRTKYSPSPSPHPHYTSNCGQYVSSVGAAAFLPAVQSLISLAFSRLTSRLPQIYL